MFTRSILIPSLVVCAVAAPFLLSPTNFSQRAETPANSSQMNWTSQTPWESSPIPTVVRPNSFVPVQNPQLAGYSNGQPPSQTGQNYQRLVPFALASQPIGNPSVATGDTVRPGNVPVNMGNPAFSGQPNDGQIAPPIKFGPPHNMIAGTPDMMAAQTIILPGNEFGPDLTAKPLEFLPITDFSEIFRFNVTPNWVKGRWKRISTNPGEDGLQGMRVALVTGVNSWDLHGSLTYYFDNSKKCQRITFRGWTGDPSRFLNTLTQRFDFEAQETHLAGFYLAKNFWKTTGGLLMKHPAVIYTENPAQQLAMVMEINNPSGRTRLSNDFQSLIDGSRLQ